MRKFWKLDRIPWKLNIPAAFEILFFFFNYSRYLEPSNTLHTCFSPFVNLILFFINSGPWDQPRDSAGSFLSVLAPQSPFTSQSQSFLLLIPPTEAGHQMTPSAAARRGIL